VSGYILGRERERERKRERERERERDRDRETEKLAGSYNNFQGFLPKDLRISKKTILAKGPHHLPTSQQHHPGHQTSII
jgi:hypothetical protein